MVGENDTRQNSLVLEEDDDDDDEDNNEETDDDDNDDVECDEYEDFDDDEFDDSGMFNDVANYRPDSVDASALVRRRQCGRTSSAANLLRCASLLAMPTYKKSSVRR